MALKVHRAGILSTLQDLGRYGYQRFGVPVGGVMDEYSHRLANLLVGNAEQEATLEITLAGPRLEFTEDALIGVVAAISRLLSTARKCRWRPVLRERQRWISAPVAWLSRVPGSGRRIRGAARHGQQEHLPAGWIRRFRRAFAAAGRLAANRRRRRRTVFRLHAELGRERLAYPRWSVNANSAFLAHDHHRIHFVPGRHWTLFSEESRQQFGAVEFRIAPDSDRMGYRLEGPALVLKEPVEILSEAVTFGTIQVPPDGRPIVLMANRQTTGGYPRIGEVAIVDLPLLAQLPPGDTVQFTPIALEDSQPLYLQRDHDLRSCAKRLQMRMKL
jgi:antagonist of KipI